MRPPPLAGGHPLPCPRAIPLSVYTMLMTNKRRVNITLDSAVHDEMKKYLSIMGEDFSAFVEMMSVRFLGSMRPILRRMEAAQTEDTDLTPSEVRVMFLQMMGAVQVEAGQEMGKVLSELDMIEAEQVKKAPPLESKTTSPKAAIHTPKVTKTTKAKK